MSNYGTTYNINQTGELYALEDHGSAPGLGKYASAKGTAVNSPVNYRFLKLFRGFDNEFFFFVKNQDRKPIMLHGTTMQVSLIDRSDRSTVISKKAIIISESSSRDKVDNISGFEISKKKIVGDTQLCVYVSKKVDA